METICHISLDSIASNYKYFSSRVGSKQIIPVIKANAYGHGVIEVTKHLHKEFNTNLFAVATLEEAQELAAALPDISILIFSRVFANELSELPENAIVSIESMEHAASLSASEYSDLKVHLNVNTGMNRLGMSIEQAISLISDHNTALDIQGVYSHLSSSDTESADRYERQVDMFRKFTLKIRELGFKGMIHLSSSAGALHENADHYDAIRLGIGLYGYDTTYRGKNQEYLRPAMEVKAPLVRVERISAGESVSYAEKWQAAVDTNIGTLRMGYADGYNRALTNRGVVSFQGKDYPVVGTVTMDHIMIDLENDEPPMGSYFSVIGGESTPVKVASIAKILNTITYDICCAIAKRVRRSYIKN